MIDQWSLDDIATLNPAGPRQNKGFLQTLIEFAATSENQLTKYSAELNSRDGPFVVAFGQLPYDLGLGSIEFEAPSGRTNTSVELSVQPTTLSIDPFGRPETESLSTASQNEVTITQLAGIIRLSEKRARVHPLYKSRLNNLELLDAPLGSHMVEHWMRLPEVSLAEPSRRKRPLTGLDFQRDVASRMRDHLRFATGALLSAYGVAALIDMRGRDFLYGYHTMIAPGRLAGSGAPVPILNGLVKSVAMPGVRCKTVVDIQNTIQNAMRADNPFLLRLQALHSLYLNGEPELALIGVCTTLEWFLNKSFPDLTYKRKDGQIRTGNLRSYLGSKHAETLTDAAKSKLLDVIDWRNDVTHGEPPSRQMHGNNSVNPENVMEAFCLSLNIYRQVNSASQKFIT